MKALLFAGVMAVTYLIAITVVFHLWRVSRRAAAMFWLFWISVPFFLLAYAVTPEDLWLLPAVATESLSWVDTSFSLFVYASLVFGGVLQLYNLADRGFSLRILIDILESPAKAVSVDDVMRGYGGGKGIGWMFDKRIDGIVENGLGLRQDGQLEITPKGMSVAKLFGALRDFLNLPGPDRAG